LRQTIEIAGYCDVPYPDQASSVTGSPARDPDRGDGAARIRLVRTAPRDAASERPRVPPVPLIGREREVAELRAALDAALGGCGRVVLIGGEPGIGKTRLASALADEAQSRGVPVWWGRGRDDRAVPAFWPWSTALRRWMDRVGEAVVAAAAGPRCAELAHVFPVLRDRIAGSASTETGKPDGSRFHLFDVVTRFLGDVARHAGLVVVLDDVHRADRSSLELLEFIATDLTDLGVLLVATYRDTEVEREHPFAGTLARLACEPSTRMLPVDGLAAQHCARWLTLAGAPGDAATIGDAVRQETNGNPFLVNAVVRRLTAEGGDACRLPDAAREEILRRLDRLGDDCRDALAVAAIFCDVIDARMLAEVLDGAAAADALARAVRDRILVDAEGGPGRYRFAHALVRRVLVDELSPSARAAWHARIAAVLERRAAATQMVTIELVRHLAAAGTSEALRKAFGYACRGGEQTACGLGWDEAVRLYESALDVSGGGAPPGVDRVPRSGALAFRRDGDVWTVRYAGGDIRLKDGKGPRYLATLLAAPGRELHVLELAAMSAPPTPSGAAHGVSIGSLGGSLDDTPDHRARREYRTRLTDLRAELDEAERLGDTGRAERLRVEVDQLVAELAGRFSGRSARRGPAETARKAVTKVLRTQIGRLLDLHPALGRHLRDTVRLGTVCVYAPTTLVEWSVGFGPA
jgi:hypothetical protein